jgi:DNA repair ATPase RecN
MRLGLLGSSEAAGDAVEAREPSPAQVAARVRVPAALQHARRTWSELRRRHSALTVQLRELIATAPHPEGDAARKREIARLDAEIAALAQQVQAAAATVQTQTPAFADAIQNALSPMRRQAADDAISAADSLAAALHRLAEIDREIWPLAPNWAWNLRPLQPSLAPLRRRIIALRGGGR